MAALDIEKEGDDFNDTLILNFTVRKNLGIGWGMVYNVYINFKKPTDLQYIPNELSVYAAVGKNVNSKFDLQMLETGKSYFAKFYRSELIAENKKIPNGTTGFVDESKQIYLLIDLYPEEMKGNKVEITGIAYNAKAGALLLTEDQRNYYIEGLDEWPSYLIEKKVIVSGIIKSEYFDEKNLKTEKGEYIQGMSGEKLILQNGDWKLK